MLRLRISDLEHGALTAKLWNGQAEALLEASYLTDAPRDLLKATVSLLTGTSEARFRWLTEPGEYRFVLRRIGGEVHLHVLWFSDWAPGEPDSAGQMVFSGKETTHQWARVVAREFHRIRRELGDEKYKSRWVLHDFPAADLERLEEVAEQLA